LHTWPKAAVPSQAISAPSTQISFSERAAALNAASLAILDSGSIASSGVLVAVSTALVGARANAYAYVDTADANGSGAEEALELIMDPTPEEEERAVARYGIAWAFGKGLSTVKKEDGAQSGMQHDGDEEKEAAVCWVESEGRFSREQVCL
jgi:exosome complex component RRP46